MHERFVIIQLLIEPYRRSFFSGMRRRSGKTKTFQNPMKRNVLTAILTITCLFTSLNSVHAQVFPFGINSNCTNIIKNGNFSNGSSDWTLGTGWQIDWYASNHSDVVNSVISQ